jgi:glycosyltransferase involved in cell wall biosynthesis
MSSGINDSWELIVVLDRVPREDFESENPIESKRINCVVIQSESPGIVAALNLGLSACKGKFIARIDEDDLVSPERFQKQLRYLQKHSRAVAVGGNLRLISENGNTIGFKSYSVFHKTILRKIHDHSPLAHPGSMYLAAAVRGIGGYRLGVPEDWDLWIRLSKIGTLHNLNTVVISYRQHDAQLSKTKLYKAVTARRLVFLSDNKSESELLALSENPDLVFDSCRQISMEGAKKNQFTRLQRLENFERLRISRTKSGGITSKLTHLWNICKYPNLILPEFLLRTRSIAIGMTWKMKN